MVLSSKHRDCYLRCLLLTRSIISSFRFTKLFTPTGFRSQLFLTFDAEALRLYSSLALLKSSSSIAFQFFFFHNFLCYKWSVCVSSETILLHWKFLGNNGENRNFALSPGKGENHKILKLHFLINNVSTSGGDAFTRKAVTT